MKKIVVLLAFIGLLVIGVDAQAASLNDKANLNPQVVANHHGGGPHGGPRGGGHSMGGGHRGGAPAMRGHHGGGHVRPHGAPAGMHRPHHGPRPMVHHPRPHRVGRHVPPPPHRHRFYVGSRVIRYPYYADCINPMGYYDPYYCGMYYPPAVIRYSTPSMGFSVAF